MTQTTKGFDFTEINKATYGMKTGMKIGVIKGFMTQIVNTLNKFENDLEEDAIALHQQVEEFQKKYQEQAAKAQQKE